MEKIKSMNFMSLSQDEILGFGDEIVNVNVTKLKKYFYYLIGNLTAKMITKTGSEIKILQTTMF